MKLHCNSIVCPQKDQQETRDKISTLKKQEQIYQQENYLYNYGDIRTLDTIECREKIVVWLFEVIEFSNLSRETVGIVMSYLDRFLATKQGSYYLFERRNLQLAGIVCLMLAIKVNESMDIDMSYIHELSQGSYSTLELTETEREILIALRWRCCPPTASIFIEHILDLFPQELVLPESTLCIIKYLAQLQIDASIKDCSFISCKPSVIAMASVLNAVDSLQSYLPLKTLQDLEQYFVDYHFEIDATGQDVSEARERLIKQANLSDSQKNF